MSDLVVEGLIRLNQVFEAGIAISATSLFLRALSFNLRDRVSRAFAIILACVTFVYAGEAISGAVSGEVALEFWLRFQWVGIVLLPAAYVHFSDALLETTGRPSRWRRRVAVRLAYGISALFLLSLLTVQLVGPLVMEAEPLPHLERTWLSAVFTGYYVFAIGVSGVILWRAYGRTVLSASRRRMRFLLLGAVAVAVGSYPFLLLGPGFAAGNPLTFMVLAALGNLLVFYSLVLMAYAVAFFGVSWPDRVVKSRLVKWFLRGPITVFIVMVFITLARAIGEGLSLSSSVAIPILTAVTVLLLEHAITLAAPVWERWVFDRDDRENLEQLQTLHERLFTKSDLRQFLEAVLAAVCDLFQVSTAFVAALEETGLELVVVVGEKNRFSESDLSGHLLEAATSDNGGGKLFGWGDYWLMPLYSESGGDLLGLLGVLRKDEHEIEEERLDSLELLGLRAAMALEDRRLQQQLFQALGNLTPRVEYIQRLRAASRFDQSEVLTESEALPPSTSLSSWVKDALTHYWGGPKLTKNPLLDLQVVQEGMEEHDGNPANALRSILKEAVERIRPEGERRFTAEWILYNILELKFMQGRKVREVALRLAMSEADLYRKQRVAIEAVAAAIADMERAARENGKNGSYILEEE